MTSTHTTRRHSITVLKIGDHATIVSRTATKKRERVLPAWWIELLAPFRPVVEQIEYYRATEHTQPTETAAIQALPQLFDLLDREITEHVSALQDRITALEAEIQMLRG